MVLVHFGLAGGFFTHPFLLFNTLGTMTRARGWISPPGQVILQEWHSNWLSLTMLKL